MLEPAASKVRGLGAALRRSGPAIGDNQPMSPKDEHAVQGNGRAGTRPYHAPRLVEYGAIRELTASGSGTQQEKGGSGQNPSKRP